MSLDNYLGTRVTPALKKKFQRQAAQQGGASNVLRVLIEWYASANTRPVLLPVCVATMGNNS